MLDSFYIMADKRDTYTWYMLIVKKTHFCISCGSDFDKILDSLKRCVKRHRIEERLLNTLSQLDCGGTISPATLVQRRKYYAEFGDKYSDIVHSTVRAALKEAWLEDKMNSPLHKTRTRLKKASMSLSPKKEVPKKDLPTTPKFLAKKPKVFKHK